MECSVCGNTYSRPMQITVGDGGPLTFDSFECAIHALGHLSPLRNARDWTRRRDCGRNYLLLRPLRPTTWSYGNR